MSHSSFVRHAWLVGATAVLFAGPAWAAGDAPSETAAADPKTAPAAETNGKGDAEKIGEKVLVLPYQPIFRSVAQKKVATATSLLNKELAEKDGIVVIRGAVANGHGSASAPSLDEAKAATKAAEAAEAAKNIDAAIAERKRAVDLMEKNAGAIEDAETYILAHHYLARALLWAAKDAEATAMIATAARMAPNLELPKEEFSRLYRRWFVESAKNVVKDKRGELFVKSGLPGAKIFLDGREMDVAPVVLQETVPGKHLLTAVVDGVPQYGGVVDVKAGKKTTFTVSFGGSVGGDSVGDVADAIAANSMSTAAVKSAVQAGKSAGAKFVVAGGMAKDEDHFNVHTFVIDVDKGAVAPLDIVQYDLELLTAEADVFRIVQAIEASVKSFAGKPSVKTIEQRIRSQSTINEVDASPAAIARRKVDDDKKDGPRRVFKPLKGGTIIIKDEED